MGQAGRVSAPVLLVPLNQFHPRTVLACLQAVNNVSGFLSTSRQAHRVQGALSPLFGAGAAPGVERRYMSYNC